MLLMPKSAAPVNEAILSLSWNAKPETCYSPAMAIKHQVLDPPMVE